LNCILFLKTSRELKVCGAIGSCVSLAQRASNVSETELGMGGTNAWKICGVYPNSTLSIFFEVLNQVKKFLMKNFWRKKNISLFSNKHKLHQVVNVVMFNLLHNINIYLVLKKFELQLLQESMSIIHDDNRLYIYIHMNVFSLIDAASNMPTIAASFDQECASVAMARIAVYRSDTEEGSDVLRWLDKMLIRLV
jgi:protein transport protein SEC23